MTESIDNIELDNKNKEILSNNFDRTNKKNGGIKMGKNMKLKSAITAVILMGYILNIFFAYKILQSSNILTIWNRVISIAFIVNIILNFIMAVYSGIESKKNMNKENILIFIVNKVMLVVILILLGIGYFFWKNQI